MSQTQLSPELVSSYELEGYEDRVLTQKEIIKMLDMHGCNWHIVDGNLFASDCEAFGPEYVNATNWTLFNCLSFLNY